MLGENPVIDGVGKLHTRLKTCAEKGTDVNLNATKVESIDTASLQLLAVFVEQVCANGQSVNWQSTSDALTGTAKLAGLDVQLNLV